jgi:hypothetical protein
LHVLVPKAVVPHDWVTVCNEGYTNVYYG